jgi:hypothetical protein
MLRGDETIHISYVHHGEVNAFFMQGILDILRKYPTTIGSYTGMQGLGLLTKTRNMAVAHFLDETKDDWMLIIDADEYLPISSFKKLIESADNWKVPILSGLVFGVSNPLDANYKPRPCIFKDNESSENVGFDIYYDYKVNTLMEVAAAGTGCLLVHRRVFEQLREEYQEKVGKDWCWFTDGPYGNNDWISEDLSFCKRVKESGFKIHAHTGAILPHSKNIWVSEANYIKWLKDPDRLK